MLSQSPRAFTEMLNVFRIESSRLTCHLESLGKLISKAEDDSYKLSAYGETAVSMMGKVEEKVEGMEEVIGVIYDAITRRRYWLPEVCDLFFTDKRVVGAVVLSRKATAGHNGLIGGFHLGYLGWYLAKRDRERYRRYLRERSLARYCPLARAMQKRLSEKY